MVEVKTRNPEWRVVNNFRGQGEGRGVKHFGISKSSGGSENQKSRMEGG